MNGSFKSYLIIAIGIIVLAAVLSFVFSIIVALLPVILVVVAILAIMNLIARHRAAKAVQSFFEEAEKQASKNYSADHADNGDVIDVEAKEVNK